MPNDAELPLQHVILVSEKRSKYVMYGLDREGWLWVRSYVGGRWGDWHRDSNPRATPKPKARPRRRV